MRYHTTAQLSEHLFETPEGFLLCPGVAIARTGAQEYAADEVAPAVAGNAEVVIMLRDEKEVFAPEAMASFEGKPLTIEHPDSDVTPENWRSLAVGHVQNVRRGEGSSADLLLADILVTDAEAIRLIREEGLRELSCGYDADNEAVRPGVGRQTNISGNHVALVPHGRAGRRCRINDRKDDMGKNPTFLERLLGNPKVRKAVRDAEEEAKLQDEETQEEKPAQGEGETPPATDEDPVMEKLEEIAMMLRTLIERQGTLDEETQDEDLADEDMEDEGEDQTSAGGSDSDVCDEDTENGDDPARTTDRALRRRSADADTLRRAAILAPNHRFRATDRARAVKRIALRDACRDPQMARVVKACLKGRSLDQCGMATLDAAFTAASEVAASRNNRRTADSLTGSCGCGFGKTVTPADINRANREFYSKRS